MLCKKEHWCRGFDERTFAMKQFDVIVIGGGPSGMMAAVRAQTRGKSVLLLEKNKNLGEKLKITGGGRCNITNAEFDEHLLLKNYGKASSFLYSAFSQFGVQDTFDFFARNGLPLVVQEGKRAFPKTQKALDVFNVFEKFLRAGSVTVKTGARVSRINTEGKNIKSVSAGGVEYHTNAVILATGGSSHPETGSTGDGFRLLTELGHTVHIPTPTIVPMAIAQNWKRRLAGVAVSGIKITFFLNKKKQFSRRGDLIFTHLGISGPVVLNSSGKVGDLLHEGQVTASLDFFADSDERVLENRIITLFDMNKNKALKNVFSRIAPQQLLGCMQGIGEETKVHSVTKEQRKIMIRTLKALPITITGLMGLDRAVVVDGGVDIAEINHKSICSTLFDNFFIVGDLLNINRPSGGYSLQLCWTTGWVAGNCV